MSGFRGGGNVPNNNKGRGGGFGGGPSATSKVTRRLHQGTPPKNNNDGSGSSSAGPAPNNHSNAPPQRIVVNGAELPPGVPDISKLTAEQKLVMLQRMMRNEYSPGAMWEGLLADNPSNTNKKQTAKEPVAPAAAATEVTVKKNLGGAFMECDTTGDTMLSSGCSVIRGNGGANRFVETATTTTVEEGLGLDDDQAREEDEDETTIRSGMTEEEEEYQPEFCKLVDDLLMAHDHYKIFLERAIEAVVEKNFEEAFPEARVIRLFQEIDGFVKELEAFSSQSPAENMKLFFPSDSKRSPNKAVLDCPVEQQEELIATLYKLSNIMTTLRDQMKNEKWKNMEAEVDEKLHVYKKTVDKMERDLKDLEKIKKSISEGYTLLTTFANHNTSGSSGDILNLETLKSD